MQHSRANRRIMVMLALCAAALLCLQTFWLVTFYRQVKAEFNMAVRAGLDLASTRLEEQRQLRSIKNMNTGLKMMVRQNVSNNEVQVRRVDTVIDQVHRSRSDGKRGVSAKTITRTSFSFSEGDTALANTFVYQTVSGRRDSVFGYRGFNLKADTSQYRAMRQVVDKLFNEVHILGREENNADSLEMIIKDALLAKGVDTPFEFSLRKMKGAAPFVIAESHGFSENLRTYRTDLAANRIIDSGRHLLVQFPHENMVLLAGMKGNLILSLMFLGVLVSVFFFTTREILRQKQLSDMRSDFVNNMTHELKTPIATISLAIDAMQNPLIKNDDSRYHEYCSILKEENQKLNGHVERVLQMSMLEKKQIAVKKQRTDLREVVNAVARDFSLQLASKNMVMHVLAGSSQVVSSADMEHMHSAISNLVDNAIKYSPPDSGVTVSIRAEYGHNYISVKDQGPGIPKQEQGRIFEKFYRVPQYDLHDVKGFGLGLSYVKWVAEAHGGRVAVQSEPGRGASFTIILPQA